MHLDLIHFSCRVYLPAFKKTLSTFNALALVALLFGLPVCANPVQPSNKETKIHYLLGKVSNQYTAWWRLDADNTVPGSRFQSGLEWGSC